MSYGWDAKPYVSDSNSPAYGIAIELMSHGRVSNSYVWDRCSVRWDVMSSIWDKNSGHVIQMTKVPLTQDCDLRATFERPEKWLGRSVVAQTQKVLFLCKCCSTTPVPSLNDHNGCIMSQQVAQRRQSGGRTIAKVAQGLPWSPNGGTVVATMITQWTLLVGQRSHNGGTRKAVASLKLIHNVHNSSHFFTGRPMADHCASNLRPWRCVCLPPASFEPPLGDRPPRRPFCDCLNMLKTSRRPWRPWQCLNVLRTTLERPRQPFGLLSAFHDDLASFVVAQGKHKGRSPCIKGVLVIHSYDNSRKWTILALWVWSGRGRSWLYLVNPPVLVLPEVQWSGPSGVQLGWLHLFCMPTGPTGGLTLIRLVTIG